MLLHTLHTTLFHHKCGSKKKHTYLCELKIHSFCRYGRKHKQSAFLIASNFVIHPQILIFSVFKIVSLFFLMGEKVLSVASPDNRQNDRVSTHSVTQGSAALPLSACCAVARRSASR